MRLAFETSASLLQAFQTEDEGLEFRLARLWQRSKSEGPLLPERVIVTVTVPVGAALSRIVEVPLAPLASDSEVGVAVIDGVGGTPIVKGTSRLAVLNTGVPLSNAVACAVWLPAARPVALKL